MQLDDAEIAAKSGPHTHSTSLDESTKRMALKVQKKSENSIVAPSAVVLKVYVNRDYEINLYSKNFELYPSIYTKGSEPKIYLPPTSVGLRSFNKESKNDIKGNFIAEATGSVKQHVSYRLPIFVTFISLLEIFIFLYNYITINKTENDESLKGSNNVPTESVLVYRPDRRLEIWRFVSYMVLHANWFHLSFNITIQLLFGVPLEMMHGSVRIAVIYMAGVFAGSLGTSIVDSAAYLVGASGGVYALLSAQLANFLLNFTHLRYGILQFLSFVIFVLLDLSHVIYMKLFAQDYIKAVPTVSYIAHMTGSLAGLSMGLLVLKYFDPNTKSNLIWWLALTIYISFTFFAIIFNLINTMTAQELEEEGNLIKKHLLDNLGIS